MPSLDDIIRDIKSIRWEEKSRIEIEAYASIIAGVKQVIGIPGIALLKDLLRAQLTGADGHAKDDLAKRMFNHYLDGWGADFTLTLNDMSHINTTPHLPGPIDLRKAEWGDSAARPEWTAALRAARAPGAAPQDYTGSLLWGFDNGAIGNFTVRYEGKIGRPPAGSVEWKGSVMFYDWFDLDPRWDWSTANPGGRSRGGERRTRIGYMLALGADYEVRSPRAVASQLEGAASMVLAGRVVTPGSTAPGGDLSWAA